MSGAGGTRSATSNGSSDVNVKAGRHREATLYRALAGAGAGDGRTLAQLREAASAAYERLELPVWRRSGFWSTSLQSLDLTALDTQPDTPGVPDVVTRTLPDRARAGRIVQSAGSVVHVELAPELAERGVILCSLEDAFREHGGAGVRVVLQAPADRPPEARGGERGVLERGRVPARPAGRDRRGPV